MHTLASPPTDPALAEWVARRVIAQHVHPTSTGRTVRPCAQCPPAVDAEACPMLVSAISYLRMRARP